jgi:hypothetical protein
MKNAVLKLKIKPSLLISVATVSVLVYFLATNFEFTTKVSFNVEYKLGNEVLNNNNKLVEQKVINKSSSFLTVNTTTSTKALKPKPQYNDEEIRLKESETCYQLTECRHFRKKNTWHPTKFAIVSASAWDLCMNSSGSGLDLFVYLWTRPSSVKVRQAIRKTWANRSMFPKMNVGFILGLSSDESVNSMIIKESEQYGDIVQGDFLDTYRNLSFKSLTAWRWIIHNCKNAKYYLKIDGI